MANKANKLTEFEGLDVSAVGVEMPNAAGGLQEAMKFDPVELHHGDTGYIALAFTVTKVRFDPIVKGENEPLRRVHVLRVDEAALIDGDLVKEHLEQQRERIELAKEKAEGVTRLGLEGGDAPPVDEYATWTHAKLKDACKDRGLSPQGSKEELAQRLRDND